MQIKVFSAAFLGRVVGAIFIALCTFVGFGPDKWVKFVITDLPTYITPAIARGVFIALAVLTLVTLLLGRRLETARSPAHPDAGHWAERDPLEIGVLAAVSAGQEPYPEQLNGLAISRLRELKNAITRWELPAQIVGESADQHARVTLSEFRSYIAATNRHYWTETLSRWEERQSHYKVFGKDDWRIDQAMEHIATELGLGDMQDIGKKYNTPASLLTRAFREGRAKAWGVRVLSRDSAELTRRAIPPSEWADRELIPLNATLPHTRVAQTKSVGAAMLQPFSDLHVNEAAIRSIKWAERAATPSSRIRLSEAVIRAYEQTQGTLAAATAERLSGNGVEGWYAAAITKDRDVSLYGRKPPSRIHVEVPQEHLQTYRFSEKANELVDQFDDKNRYVDLEIGTADLERKIVTIKAWS
jgi:hypothetical protein